MFINEDEVLFQEYGDKVILYIPTRGLLSMCSESTLCKIKNNEINITSLISSYPFIEIDDLHHKEIGSFPWLSLNISNGCQLRCDYCYLSADTCHNDELMDFDQAKNIFEAYIEYLIKNFPKEIENNHTIWISFFGGAEPTYNLNVFYEIVNYINDFKNEKGMNIKLRITTNGFYSDKVAHFIADNFASILLSFDGPEQVQNKHRKNTIGNDTFLQVFENAKIFYAESENCSYRITVSKETLPNLKNTFDFYTEYFPKAKIIVGRVSDIGRAKEEHLAPSLDDYNQSITEILSLYHDELNFTALNKKALKNIRTCYCGAVQGKSYIISKDNIIRCCAHNDELHLFEIGEFDNKSFVFNQKKIQFLQNKYNVRGRVKCNECIAKYYCAGGCPANENYDKEYHEAECRLTKKIFLDRVIIEVFRKGGEE